jgi:hypothetical protein
VGWGDIIHGGHALPGTIGARVRRRLSAAVNACWHVNFAAPVMHLLHTGLAIPINEVSMSSAKISASARAVLRHAPSNAMVFKALNSRLAAQLGVHTAGLTDTQLDVLPSHGLVLCDPESFAQHRIDHDALAIKCHTIDDDEIAHLAAGRHCVMLDAFHPLTEWIRIERHLLRLNRVTWDDLSREDRIACVSTMFAELTPLEYFLNNAYRVERCH